MSGARRFEVRVLLEGGVPEASHLRRFDIDASRYGRCDAADIVFAVEPARMTGQVAWFEALTGASADVVVQVRDVLDVSSDWTTMFHGVADHVAWCPDIGTVTLECRDYMARLVDMRMQAAWLNLTGVELVEAVVAAASLHSEVSFPQAMSGQFWQIEHKRSAVMAQHRFQTAFDLAAFVAREAGCDLYASGRTIVCRPVADVSDATVRVEDVTGRVLGRTLLRDCQLAQGVAVHVASWDSRQRVASQVYYDGRTYSTKAPENGFIIYSFRVPGRRSDDVRRIAAAKFARIAAHGIAARVRLPGQPALGPRQFLRGLATSGVWSGVFAVDAVRSVFSAEGGFVQDVTVRQRSGGGV